MKEPPRVAAGHDAILIVTGGIAAYKACEIVRRLREHGLTVRVAMTRSAAHLVAPQTFAALSGNRVVQSLFEDPHPEQMAHVRWGESADLLCVAPATADFLAKMAHGIADDFASTLCLATPAPLLVAPAMEDDMLAHVAVRRNLATLRERGALIVGPASGALASGRVGPGRMAEPDEIVAAAVRLTAGPRLERDLSGRRVVVTAGPTYEALDPIRFLGNRSSGKMGFALAREAAWRGADVTLVSGPTRLPDPDAVRVERVESAAAMAAAVDVVAGAADVVIMAAAVADFTAAATSPAKIKKEDRGTWAPELVRTTDILAALGKRDARPLLVGFAAETEKLEARARAKLAAKGCDLIVANRIGEPGQGVGADDNEVIILDRDGGRQHYGPAAKWAVAVAVWDAIVACQAR